MRKVLEAVAPRIIPPIMLPLFRSSGRALALLTLRPSLGSPLTDNSRPLLMSQGLELSVAFRLLHPPLGAGVGAGAGAEKTRAPTEV